MTRTTRIIGAAAPQGKLLQVASVEQAADASYTGAYAVMGAMTLDVTTLANSRLVVLFSAAVATSGAAEIDFQLRVDAVVVAAKRIKMWGAHDGIDMKARSAALSAGVHTVDVRWAPAGTTVSCRPTTYPNYETANLIAMEIAA